ncbi:MAG: DNA cytosine methyltransferase, partial [Chitinophagales bacterium]
MSNYKRKENMPYTEVCEDLTIVEEPQIEIKFNSAKSAFSKSKTFKVVSLFSGCGGLDLGFCGDFNFRDQHYRKNKFSVEFANDIDTSAEFVYNANQKFFGKHKLNKNDIKNVDYKAIPDFDFLIAGFPCQPFSNAGLRKG